MSAAETIKKLKDNIRRVIVGKEDAITLLAVSFFCGGHVLIEDVPGSGKTMLAKAFAVSAGCGFSRIQFTPDLLPSDITGINYFNMKESEFEFIPGPIFSNIILADEINRATPKTQSGLLECMEERQVTIEGRTYALPFPFMVIATQNPVENMGVFPLPEAQLDRFMVKLGMGYPTHEENVSILERFGSENPLNDIGAAVTDADIAQAREEIGGVFVHGDLLSYITSVAEATRENPNVILGVSPRGCIALLKVSKGIAAAGGRNYIIPDDIKAAAIPVLAHRLILKTSVSLDGDAARRIIGEILESTAVPTEDFDRYRL